MSSSYRIQVPVLLLCAILAASGCKRKPAGGDSSSSLPSSNANTSPSAPTSAGAKPVGAFPATTKVETSSTLRVQVVAGAIPPRVYAGALVHRDEAAAIPGLQGKNRCVLALLTDWSDAQLRNPECKFTVFCSPPEPQGAKNSMKYPGRLLSFDEKTGLAAIGYLDVSDAGANAGYHLTKNSPAGEVATAIRATISAAANEAASVPFQPAPPIRLEAGLFNPRSGTLRFPPSPADFNKDESPLAVGADGQLIGFLAVAEDAATAKLVPVQDYKFDIKGPRLKLLGIGFGKVEGYQIPFLIKTEPEDPKFKAGRAFLSKVVSPQAGLGSQEDRPFYDPIPSANIEPLLSANPHEWRGSLRTPQTDGQELEYLLQLGWTAIRNSLNPDFFSRPFLVKFVNKGGVLITSVTGLQNLTGTSAASQPKIPAIEFAMEAPIRDFHEVAGGREVLLQLDGAPFWKRFSMERNEWLPLPEADLSNAYLTGNLSSLFILQRGTGELRKYDLADLKQTSATKLAAGATYVAALAGCNTDHAPVQVLTKSSILALAAENLQPRTLVPPVKQPGPGNNFAADITDTFYVTGDGLSIRAVNERPLRAQHYTSDLAGAHDRYFDTDLLWTYGSAGVSGAYIKEGGFFLTTAATPDGTISRIRNPAWAPAHASAANPYQSPSWLAPNSPTILQFVAGDPSAIPELSNRIVCSSYFDSAPFAEAEVPEWAVNNVGNGSLENKRCVAFDPYSLRLGVVSMDRTKWAVHQIIPLPGRTQPVLLNWPDTVFTRGSGLRFKPVILAGQDFSAELLGVQSTAQPKIADGQLTMAIAPAELSSLEMLMVKVPGKESALSYSIPIHLLGQELEFAAAPSVKTAGLNAVGAGFKSVSLPKDAFRVLRSTLHVFNDPVRQVIGPLGGHLVLMAASDRLDFFSLESRKITKSVASPANVIYFSGAGALFEYNPASRTLTRISVPAGLRERSMTLPGNLQLHAFGLGTAPDSPLTLILEQIQRRETEHFDGLTFTMTESKREAIVLDNHTFSAAWWAQPKAIPFGDKPPFMTQGYNTFSMLPETVVLPASHDGQFVMMPGLFFALTRDASYSVRFPDSLTTLFRNHSPSSGSISGTIVANSEGAAFTGRVSDDYNHKTPHRSRVTPCGRYRLIEVLGPGNDDNHVEVRSVGTDQLLFHLGRLTLNLGRFEGMNDAIKRQLLPLGDDGPLAILSAGGKALEIVDCDIPRLALTINPTDFHVTSQCPPCVASGATLEYQIHVNNPAVIAECRLREPVPGASMTPQGLLRYTAPVVTIVTQVQITAEIRGKDGRKSHQEMPIYVLPPPPRTAPAVGRIPAI